MSNKKQIFCFTYAGGTTTFFDEIEKDLSEFELVKLEYSGHGKRHKEPFYNNFDELADDLFDILIRLSNGSEYALFGYSMGTISLIEVLKRINKNRNLSLPSNVFLAAHEPKTKRELSDFTPEELDEWVKARTIRFGAIPQKLINNESFWRMYLPLYRADYSIISKYCFDDLSMLSDIPTTVFYSETDTKYEDMKLWMKIFTGDIEYYQFDGTHFFIQNHHSEIASIIQRRMRRNKNDF